MTGVNEEFYQPATRPGDIIEVEDEETGEPVKHLNYLTEFSHRKEPIPPPDKQLQQLDDE